MDNMPLVAVIFYSLPESIILFAFGMTIVGEYIHFKKIIISAIISAFSSMIIRHFIPFGIHTIIGIFILSLLFWKLLKLKSWKAIISSLISLIVLILLETIICPIILETQGLTLEELWDDKYRRILDGYPDLIIYGFITWLLYSKKIFLIGGSRVGGDDKYSNSCLLITFIILFQGIFLALINMHLDFSGNYLLPMKLLYLIFFISSILFIKWLYFCEKLKNV